MKILTSLIFLSLFAATLAGCGVKGKPQAPLKKTESKNEPTRKQSP
jgi:hypothetical protein